MPETEEPEEETVLNISLIANSLLDLEATPPADDAEDEKKATYGAYIRKETLDLHYLLEEEFKDKLVHASSTYLEALHEFTRLEMSEGERSDAWQRERNATAGNVLAHLRENEIVKNAKEDGEWPTCRPQEDLKTFVTDFMAGKIFSDRHVDATSGIGITQVFYPLMLGGLMSRAKHEIDNIGLIYEYLNNAGPRSVNGQPNFFSMRLLNQSDWDRCAEAIGKRAKQLAELGEVEV